MANLDSLEIQINASSDKATDAISKLITSLEKLDSALSKLNVKDFANQMSKVSTSMSQMSKSATATGEKLQNVSRSTNTASNSFRAASVASGGFMASLKRMIPHTKSLASAFMGLYAKLFLLRKLFSLGFKAIDIASDLTEVQNVVDQTFGNMSGKLEDFAKTSRQTFGLSELSAKTYASQFQGMFKAMGITSQQVAEVNERLAEDSVATAARMAKGYDVMNNDISDMSINLTKLAADMASFYNQDASDTSARLQAGVVSGQSRALRQYGLDLTVATLQEYAWSKGIQASVKEMTQAQKAMLRYQYVLERLNHVQGDFQRTISTWHNQIQLLRQNFQALGAIVGSGLINAFKPAIMKINSAMNTLIKLVEKAMNAIGKLLGWQIEISEVGVALDDMDEALEGSGGGGSGGGTADDLEDAADAADDAADGADDLADGLKKAKDAAKKLKDYTLGIDELNIFHVDDEVDDLEDLADAIDDVTKKEKKAKDAGSGGDAAGGGSGAAAPVSGGGVSLRPYESDIDSWFELGRKISKSLAEMMESIDWDSIYQKARNFGKNLAEFLNGLITPRLFGDIGKTIASALNTALHFLDSFGETFDWKNFGHSIAVGINNFFSTFDFKLAAETANKWIKGILDSLITAIQDTEWYEIGQKIGEMIADIDFSQILLKIGRLIWEAINAAIKFYEGLFDAAPIETALATIGAAIILTTTLHKSKIVGIVTGGVTAVKNVIGTVVGAFSNFDTIYTGTGSPIEGLNGAIKSVHDKLSTTTKFVGGVVTAFLEFETVRSSIRNLITDTGDWASEIAKVATAVGGAFISFSFLTGSLQKGGLATLIAGIAGALVGVAQALDDIAKKSGEKAFKGMIDATSSVSKSLDDIVTGFGETTEQLTSEISTFNSKFEALDTSKEKISELVTQINGIATAWLATNEATEGQLQVLQQNLESLTSIMSDYISGQYDLAIQQEMINMRIMDATGNLTDAEKDAYGERIAALYEERDATINATNEQIAAVQNAASAYTEAVSTYGKDSIEAAEALRGLTDATISFNNYAYETGAASDELTEALNTMSSSAENMADKVEGIATKVNLAKDGVGGFVEEKDNVVAAIQEMSDKFNSGQEAISTYRDSVIEGVDTAASINEKQAASKMALDQLTAYYLSGFQEIQDTVVAGIGDVVSTAQSEWEASGGHIFGFANEAQYVQNAIDEYVKNFVEPIDQEMAAQMDALGVHQSTYAKEACDKIAAALFDKDVYGTWGSDVEAHLNDNYREIINNVGNEVKTNAIEAGKKLPEGLNEGINSEEQWGPMRHSTSTHVQSIKTEIETQLDSGSASTIGSNFIAGLKAGLSKFEEVTGQARAVAKGIADATKSELQISSPSKVAESIGQYFIDGLMSPMDVLKVTVKIMLFAAGLVDKFKEFLKPEVFQPIGAGMVNGMLTGLTEALPNLWAALTESLALFFTETLPPYFSIEMWEPLFTMLNEMFIEQFELFREWFNTEAMTVWWTEDLMSWFTWDKWNPDVFAMIESHYKKAWNTFLNWWRTSMKNWWTNDIKPWFIWDKWNPDVFEMIVTHYKLAWKNFLDWWRASMKSWWQDDVKPWFTSAQWFPDVFDMIESHYNNAWEEFISWWRSSMQEWWDADVKPWFEYDKWYEQFENIYNAAEAVFEAVAEVIREKMQEAEDACREACEAMMEMINEVIEAADAAIAKMEQLMSMAASIGSIGVSIPGFAAGGFPDTGSLFVANEAGPELVGTINGNTAVANHGEITGIRDAVYQTGNVETQLLQQIVGIAQALLDKDPVVLGDRDIAMASVRGQDMLGLNLIS